MPVKWTKKAQKDINDFRSFAHPDSQDNVKFYIQSMVKFSLNLSSSPYLGKVLFIIPNSNIEIRQLVFKKHRLLYYVDDKDHIVSALHTRKNIDTTIQYLEENL